MYDTEIAEDKGMEPLCFAVIKQYGVVYFAMSSSGYVVDVDPACELDPEQGPFQIC